MPNKPLVLNPNARVLWRSQRAIQVELGRRSIIVDGIRPTEVGALLSPDTDTSDAHPDEPNRLDQTRAELNSAGFMVAAATALRHPGPPRLAAELGALRTSHGDDGADLLGARSERVVVIYGIGSLGPLMASVLAAGGVGHVYLAGEGSARLHHCVPGGITPADEGRRFHAAATEAMHRAAPEVHGGPPPDDRPTDLVILAGEPLVDPEVSVALHQLNQAHLFAWAGGDRAVIGPTVVPGLSSCLRCADLARLDRDDAWSSLAAQLSVPPRRAPASSVALSTTAGGLAALQALAYLDGAEVTTIDGTLEFELPDWRLRRRSWLPHSGCTCQFNRQTGPN